LNLLLNLINFFFNNLLVIWLYSTHFNSSRKV